VIETTRHFHANVRSLRLIAWLLLALLIALAIRRWVWMPVLIVGDSMLPTLRSGQFVGLNKMAYAFQPPRRGDIVSIWTASEFLAKRVVGLPGEKIMVRGGEVFVNGTKLPEPYVTLPISSNTVESGLLEINWFVVAGDNRCLESPIAVVNRDRIAGRFRASPP